MNKQDFLSAVRQSINNKSVDSLKKVVLDFARLIPRDEFEEALSLLEKSNIVTIKNTSIDLMAAVKQLCESIESGAYSLTWEYDDGYYDGYWSDDETLTDEDGLSEKIQELIEATMIYVNEKRYTEALSAFDEIFSLSISIEDYDDIDINALFFHELISLDLCEVLRYYAYVVLMVLCDDERIEKLYDVFGFSNYTIALQEIAQTGTDDIPCREEFEEQWIKFLMTIDLYHYEHILIDAVLFSGGIRSLHDFTIEHGVKYQTAYIQLAEKYISEKDYSHAVSVIMDAFSKLNGINRTLTILADLLLDIGSVTDNPQLIDKAAWEGFSSSLDLRHFINIYNLKNEKMKSEAMEHLNRQSNKSDDCNYIRFLYGNYEAVYDACVPDKKFLGWSTSEKGKMIPLFVALLANGEKLSQCIKKLIESSFPYSKIKDAFFDVLTGSFKFISDTERKAYFEWCLKETEGRVEGIVRGQHRGSYYKASALIVSLAEVMRSAGNKEEAARFIVSYKEKYPRHTSFRACLQQDIGLARFGKLF